ncbi:MAG: YebC/PmpR family DNA-binding transcriptional regulator [Anaerolineae bacterium]|nr:YebC/PmpR family DNA-binding transcriptional regulator [Anaerolineae bacterium]
MSGHSKWATIKRAKGANDAKRGRLFTRLGRELTVAAREGGGDPDANFRLRLVLDKAKRANMPKENIDRAIKRGTGELKDAGSMEEVTYEGYGPHGTAFLIEVLTDNKNRTVADVRHVFSRLGGNLGADGCVAWMFSRKGYIAINLGDDDPEEVALLAIDAGAEDVEISEDLIEVYTDPSELRQVQETIAERYEIETAELSWIPQSTQALDERATLQTMKLIDTLEDLDDVRQVYTNLDISDEAMAMFEKTAS